MNIEFNFSKIAKFILRLSFIAAGLVLVIWIYVAYILDQNKKIEHYNEMVIACNNIPGAIVNFSASTPVFGAGVELNCQYVKPKIEQSW